MHKKGMSLKALSLFVSMMFMFAVMPMVHAQELVMPTGKVLLTVEGKITSTNSGDVAIFDRAQLEAFGFQTLKTSNPFIKGVHTFEGVLLSDVIDAVGVTGDVITARALDGYSTDIPVADVRNYPIILAMKMDGKVMHVRSKGPLWIIYPVDQFSELKAESFSGRSIWQLTTLTVK